MKEAIPKIIGGIVNGTSVVSAHMAARMALKIFSVPKKGKIQPEEAEFLDTSEKTLLSYEDVKIMTYRWPGPGKSILLAHGWESNSYRWKDLIEVLNNHGFQVIALDAPAHGNSGGRYFNALIYSEFIKEVVHHFQPQIVIGHSVGGMASIFFQHNNPGHPLEKLILLGAPSNFKDVLQRYVDLLGYNRRVHESLSELILSRFGNRPEFYSVENFNGFDELEGLIIHDKKDLIIPFEDGEHIHDHFPNSTLIPTTGFGHGLKQAEVNKHILKFIHSN